MRRQLLYITAIFSVLGSRPLPGEEKPVITLSPELQLQASAVPDSENGVVILENRLAALDDEIAMTLADGLRQMREGITFEDAALAKQIQERHGIAREALKAPARCRKEPARLVFALLRLFDGAEFLSRRSSRAGDHDAALAYLDDMLTWSGLIRNGNPGSIEAELARNGWGRAFECALQAWESHPDQKAGLEQIEKLFNRHRMPPSEFTQVIRREAQIWAERGGPKGVLRDYSLDAAPFLVLQRPFERLTTAKILELPYDHKAEILRYETEALRIVEILQSGGPLNSWPGFNRKPIGTTFEDYQKLSNGLGEIFRDYGYDISRIGMFLTFSKDPAVDTCIAWLKAEGEGKKFVPGGPETKLDPMDGKPLRIDLEKRWIMSLAPDQKLDQGEKYPEGTGFGQVGTDPCLQVPKWRDPD